MRFFLLALAGASLVTLAAVRPAAACGGCFHEPTNPNETPSLVTDHRMAFSISKTHTILWDQVRYAGDPKEFAWVLPVRAGTEVEVGRDEFLASLDTVTAPTIAPPQVQCFYPQPTYSNASGGGGFGCGASDSSNFTASPNGGFADAGAPFSGFDAGVTIVSEKVVGPYESVIVRASEGQAITDWLVGHNFVIPKEITPTIAYYTNLGFDFVAIRLRPNVGTRAMQPIRIVSPGADGTLPLRMVSAGIGATVGLELFVISEGRYEATSFENALVDRTAVKWDGIFKRSNYAETFSALTASKPKGVWVTEHAGKDSVTPFQNSYTSACQTLPPVSVPCANDGGTNDGGTNDGGTNDGGTNDGGGCMNLVPACQAFDDLTRAFDGMNRADITITRMRANLTAAALSTDLVVGAAQSQVAVPRLIQTTEFTDSSYDPCPGGSTKPYPPAQPVDHGDGCIASGRDARTGNLTALAGIGLVGLLSWVRRRARR